MLSTLSRAILAVQTRPNAGWVSRARQPRAADVTQMRNTCALGVEVSDSLRCEQCLITDKTTVSAGTVRNPEALVVAEKQLGQQIAHQEAQLLQSCYACVCADCACRRSCRGVRSCTLVRKDPACNVAKTPSLPLGLSVHRHTGSNKVRWQALRQFKLTLIGTSHARLHGVQDKHRYIYGAPKPDTLHAKRRSYVACATDSKCTSNSKCLESQNRYTAVVFAPGQKIYCTKSKLSAD